MGLIPNKSGLDMGLNAILWRISLRDDICYTIIDFEDGMNLGLVSEDFALEYLIKLVKTVLTLQIQNT
jgi:dGTPase